MRKKLLIVLTLSRIELPSSKSNFSFFGEMFHKLLAFDYENKINGMFIDDFSFFNYKVRDGYDGEFAFKPDKGSVSKRVFNVKDQIIIDHSILDEDTLELKEVEVEEDEKELEEKKVKQNKAGRLCAKWIIENVYGMCIENVALTPGQIMGVVSKTIEATLKEADIDEKN